MTVDRGHLIAELKLMAKLDLWAKLKLMAKINLWVELKLQAELLTPHAKLTASHTYQVA